MSTNIGIPMRNTNAKLADFHRRVLEQVEIIDPSAAAPSRYYRLVTPRQP